MSGYLFWLTRWVKGEIIAIPGRLLAAVFLLFLFLVPGVSSHPYFLDTLTLTAIFTIYAASWDVLAGFTGQVNLGHALFFGIAAYTVAFLNVHLGFPPWATIPLGGLISVLGGFIVGFPALRLRGIYLSLVTLGFPIILTGLILVFGAYTGGELGISGIASLSGSSVKSYYITMGVMVVSLFVMYKFTDAESKIIRIGVILHAIREDEITARSSGINTTNYKLLAFAVSGFFGGIAGSLYAHSIRVAGPSTLDLFLSFQAILWTVFGGMRTIYGPVVGVFFLYPLTEFLRIYEIGEHLRFIAMAVVMILILLYMPEGLTIWVRDKLEVICPRCKLANMMIRRSCRACGAPLHLK